MQTKIAIIAVLCFLLTNCGFHMRGSNTTIDLKDIAIKTKKPYSDLGNSLREAAAQSGIEVTTHATWEIRIEDAQLEKMRVTSSITAQRDRFSLNYRVTFYLTRTHDSHEDLFGPINIERQTIFQDNENEVTSKYNEEQSLIDELRLRVARAILDRSAFIAKSPPSCKAHHENKTATTI